MRKKECVAMLLAGGQGSRLGLLTKDLAKPAVPFGGKYRIIDFALSNCHNSGIDTVGVLTQYKPLALNSYIGIGSAWDLDRNSGGVYVLPPYLREHGGEWYKGTADAIFQNINFIDLFDPEFVLVLSGDHIYKMDYSLMLEYHRLQQADATIAVIAVPWEEASRFGILSADGKNRITDFAEKPAQPQSNLASMGIYIFSWPVLKQYLTADGYGRLSSHDFGKDIIPKMLGEGQKLVAYPFSGYWKDVGTIESFWEANMDLLTDPPGFDIYDSKWRIYSVNPVRPPHYLASSAEVQGSVISEGCQIFGKVEHSVVFPGVYIGEGTIISNSVIMPDVRIEENVVVNKAIVGSKAVIRAGSRICCSSREGGQGIAVVAEGEVVVPQAEVYLCGKGS